MTGRPTVLIAMAAGTAVATAGLAVVAAGDRAWQLAALVALVHLVATAVGTLRPASVGAPALTGTALSFTALLAGGLVLGVLVVVGTLATTELLGVSHLPSRRVPPPADRGLADAWQSIAIGTTVTVAAAVAVALPVPAGAVATVAAGIAGAVAVRSLVTGQP